MPRNSMAPAVGCHFASSDSSRPKRPLQRFEVSSLPSNCFRRQQPVTPVSVAGEELPRPSWNGAEKLLHLDGCARFGELLLNGRGFVFRNAFLHGLGSP